MTRKRNIALLIALVFISIVLINDSGPGKPETYLSIEENQTDIPSENDIIDQWKGATLVGYQILEEDQTNSIELSFEGTGNIKLWFQIKKDPEEEGTRYSSPIPMISVHGNRTILVDFIDELSPIWANHPLPVLINNTVYLLDPWRDTQSSKYPTIEGWVFAFTTNHDDWTNSTQGYITDLSDNSYIDFEYSPELFLVGDPVFFNASNCYSPHGIMEYQWSIEGVTYSGLKVEHIFSTVGNQSVTLTIIDNDGNELSDTKRFETYLTEPEEYESPRYTWVSNVMDALIIDNKYAVLGNIIDNTNDEQYPIIEFYDSQGNMLQNLTLWSNEWLFADCFTATDDGGFIIAGTYELKEPTQDRFYKSGFIKFDNKGATVWNFTYRNTAYTAWKIIEKEENEYVCLITPKYGGAGVLVTLTGDGALLNWTSYEQAPTWYDFTPTSDGGYILVGNMMKVSKISINGTMEWSKSYPGLSRNWGMSVLELDDGYIIAGGATTGISDCDVTVLRLDKNGTQVWLKTFGGPEWDTASDILETSDGFIITGQTHSFGDRGSDVYVLWISPMGELVQSMVYYQDGQWFENGEKLFEGLDQIVVIATRQGENGNKPWIIILE